MGTRSVPLQSTLSQPNRPTLQILKREPSGTSVAVIRLAFWTIGILLALAQASICRYQVSSDSSSYLDMNDGLLSGSDWHRLINSVWSPLSTLDGDFSSDIQYFGWKRNCSVSRPECWQ